MGPMKKERLLALQHKTDMPGDKDSRWAVSLPYREQGRQGGEGEPHERGWQGVSRDALGSSRETSWENPHLQDSMRYLLGLLSSCSIDVAEVASMCACFLGLAHSRLPLFLPAALWPKKLLPSFLVFAFLCKNGYIPPKRVFLGGNEGAEVPASLSPFNRHLMVTGA